MSELIKNIIGSYLVPQDNIFVVYQSAHNLPNVIYGIYTSFQQAQNAYQRFCHIYSISYHSETDMVMVVLAKMKPNVDCNKFGYDIFNLPYSIDYHIFP